MGFLDTSYKTENVWICISVCVHVYMCLCLELVTLDKVLAAVKQLHGFVYILGPEQALGMPQLRVQDSHPYRYCSRKQVARKFLLWHHKTKW